MAGVGDRRLLIRDTSTGGSWSSPEMTAYTNEDHLQAIIAGAPEHVPGVPESALALRELATVAGPADVCIVDPAGEITVVECKLASNSERRRMVIGQVLDYAAAIWQSGPEAFHRQWSRQGGPDLSELDDTARDRLDRNLEDGRIHLCLAVDLIDADLRRLVEYLNRITRDDVRVTALQLAYARHGSIEILVPSTYGGEIAHAKSQAAHQKDSWTKESFLDAIASPPERAIAERLFALLDGLDERLGSHEDLWFGTFGQGGVFLHPYGLRFAPIQLWVNKAGQLMAYGNWRQYTAVREHPGFAELARFVGQDLEGAMRGFPLAEVDIDALWQIVVRCARLINEPARSE
ncbi:hypothetical protein Y013_25315 (plasmid) [Rhodococcus pyridinivorans SB3094]|uniref:Uncharacterized protein n=1 Tax=Rhodococcus pyridinivorans SB3094 TaxID=1435356 RepID=V9XSA3_9NOCA|nr:hypothetical protein [Rhodococcus pyridinivorans]AHD24272.1 hypothetical protein Y013_25315 [Rhodococcus pyridinivorans SB3094]